MSGYCKYYRQKKYVSYDGGETWIDTGEKRKGPLYEYHSTDCSYSPQPAGSGDYLTIVALDDGEVSFSSNTIHIGGLNPHNEYNYLSYSLNEGITWSVSSSTITITLRKGEKINFKGIVQTGHLGESLGKFSSTMPFAAEGNMLSLIYGDDFKEEHSANTKTLRELFENSLVKDSEHLVLPPHSQNQSYDLYSLFYNCPLLENIPDLSQQTEIYGGMFMHCANLKRVHIPESIVSIGIDYHRNSGTGYYTYDNDNENPFFDCPSLTSITVDSRNPVFDSRDNCNALIKTDSNTLIHGCINTIIPNSVIKIGKSAFYNCNAITSIGLKGSGASIEIPDSVTDIGIDSLGQAITRPSFYGTFSNCTGLTSLSLPDSIILIGDLCFSNCTGLTGELIIPYNTERICQETFRNCNNITSVFMSSGISSIGAYSFESCSGLQSITIEATTPPGRPRNVTTNRNGAFNSTNCPIYVPCESVSEYKYSEDQEWSGLRLRIQPIPGSCRTKWLATYTGGTTSSAICQSSSAIVEGEILQRGLLTVTVGDCVTKIDTNAFAYSNWLTSVTISDSVTIIGDSAFKGCTGLTDITIPSGVTGINTSAFDDCTRLTSITCLATTPPWASGYGSFDNTNECPIYVPASSVNAYKTAWSNYANRIQAIL